jgi:hypothetical protein
MSVIDELCLFRTAWRPILERINLLTDLVDTYGLGELHRKKSLHHE